VVGWLVGEVLFALAALEVKRLVSD
jgi:hypothetical protein